MTTSYRTIQQSITASNNFGSVVPAGAFSRTNGIETYAPAATGGLFDFAQTKPTPVKYIGMLLGGQSSWTLKLFNAAGQDLGTVLSGTTETSKYSELTGIVMMKGDTLRLTTAGASGAMTARITVATR